MRRAGSDATQRWAAPLVEAEVEVWQRPASTTAFPLHPLGVLHLHSRAQAVVNALALAGELDPDERVALDGVLWRVSQDVYVAGTSIRTCLDAAAERHRTQKASNPRAAQFAHLATWAVFRAAADWARGE